MNIAIEDIKFLERKYNEESAKDIVWKLALEGKSYYEISEVMKKLKGK
jgi:hypothetical protein